MVGPVGDRPSGSHLVLALRDRMAGEGFNVVLPFDAALFDGACAPVGGPAIGTLLAGAAGGVIVGDGGPAFFTRFRASTGRAVGARGPLDEFTRARVSQAVGEVLRPPAFDVSFRILYPFSNDPVFLPFQRLGQAAGLPPPGPLGLQIHPVYGPWWAYRAVVIVSLPLTPDSSLDGSCTRCARPCEAGCPVQAVSAGGFSPGGCGSHRQGAQECRDSCAARLACPVGTTHRYPEDQLAFHMRASFAQIRRSEHPT